MTTTIITTAMSEFGHCRRRRGVCSHLGLGRCSLLFFVETADSDVLDEPDDARIVLVPRLLPDFVEEVVSQLCVEVRQQPGEDVVDKVLDAFVLSRVRQVPQCVDVFELDFVVIREEVQQVFRSPDEL